MDINDDKVRMLRMQQKIKLDKESERKKARTEHSYRHTDANRWKRAAAPTTTTLLRSEWERTPQ